MVSQMHTDQMKHGVALVALGTAANASVSGVLEATDTFATPPGMLTVTGTNTTVTVGSFIVSTSASTRKKVFRPLGTTDFGTSVPNGGSYNFTTGTGTGGVQSGTAVGGLITAGQSIKAGFELRQDGLTYVVYGTAGASDAAAGVPTYLSNAHPLGYVILRKDGSGNLENITEDDIYVFGFGAGALSAQAALTANRVLVSDGSGAITSSGVTAATLAFLDATSSVQTQLNARLLKAGDTMTGALGLPNGAANNASLRFGVGGLGIFSPGSNAVAIANNGAETIRFTVDNYVRLGAMDDPVATGYFTSKFMMLGESPATARYTNAIAHGTATGVTSYYYKARGSFASLLGVNADDEIAIDEGYGYTAGNTTYNLTTRCGMYVESNQTTYTTGQFRWFTRSTAGFGERMRLTAVGSLGVSTTNPTLGVATNADTRSIGVGGGNASSATSYGIFIAGNNRTTLAANDIAGVYAFAGQNNGTAPLVANIIGRHVGSGGASGFGGRIEFATKVDGSAALIERLRIDTTGAVYAGNNYTIPTQTGYTVPSSGFVSIGEGTGVTYAAVRASSDTVPPLFEFYKARNTTVAPNVVAVDDRVFSITARAYEATTPSWAAMARYDAVVDSVAGATIAGRHAWFTNDTSNTFAERMRLTPFGHLGVGTTDPTGGATLPANSVAVGIAGTLTNSASSRGLLNMINRRATATAGDICGDILFTSATNGSTSAHRFIADIVGATEGTIGTAANNGLGGYLAFLTKADNGTALSERFRVTASGSIRIGGNGNTGVTGGQKLIQDDDSPYLSGWFLGKTGSGPGGAGSAQPGGGLQILSWRNGSDTTFGGRLGLGHLRAEATAIGAGTSLGRMMFGGVHTGGATYSPGNHVYTAEIRAVAAENWTGASNVGTHLAFHTAPSASAGFNQTFGANTAAFGTERMRILASGRILVATTTEDTAIQFNVNGRVGVGASGTGDGLTGKAGVGGTYIYGIGRATNGLALKALDAIYFYPGATSETAAGNLAGSIGSGGVWTIGNAVSPSNHVLHGTLTGGYAVNGEVDTFSATNSSNGSSAGSRFRAFADVASIYMTALSSTYSGGFANKVGIFSTGDSGHRYRSASNLFEWTNSGNSNLMALTNSLLTLSRPLVPGSASVTGSLGNITSRVFQVNAGAAGAFLTTVTGPGSSDNGLVVVSESDGGTGAVYFIGSGNVFKIQGSGTWGASIGASSYNLYYNGSDYIIQNTTGSVNFYSIMYLNSGNRGCA